MFDFGIADLLLLGPSDQEVYLVEFRCRCAVVVARGQVIRRTRGFSLVCEHVSGDGQGWPLATANVARERVSWYRRRRGGSNAANDRAWQDSGR